MIKQGLIKTRPHQLLNHDDPATKELEPEYQLQYKYSIDSDVEKVVQRDMVEKGTDRMPSMEEEADSEINIKDLLKKVKRCRTQWAEVDGELDMRLKKFDGNACLPYFVQFQAVFGNIGLVSNTSEYVQQ
eukprot:6422279-Lingulodinium_polyedra.AAC.1